LKLEYIASALNHLWIGGVETKHDANFDKRINDIVVKMNSWKDYHKFGVLFNGYAEPRAGKLHQTLFSPYNIQVDSGGLQMITLGHMPNDELRDKVYRIQAKHGTVGMCFDEIPLRTTGKTSAANTSLRQYDSTMVPDCAKQTALNICRQVEVFKEEKSKCKPYLIIQGNSVETYQEWTTECLKHIPADIQKELYGIASGGGCLGNGDLEDVERIFTLSHLDAPEHLLKNFHLLGVGSPNRICTIIKMEHLFADDVTISYDSTKHTGGVMRGQIQIGHKCMCIASRQRTALYQKIWRMFDEFQHDMLGTNWKEEDFFNALLPTTDYLYGKYGTPEENPQFILDLSVLRFAILSFSVYNMFELVDKIHLGNSVQTSGDANLFKTLTQIKDVKAFNDWKQNYGRFFKSTRTPSINDYISDLTEFFV
jgi:hypothetical protein